MHCISLLSPLLSSFYLFTPTHKNTLLFSSVSAVAISDLFLNDMYDYYKQYLNKQHTTSKMLSIILTLRGRHTMLYRIILTWLIIAAALREKQEGFCFTYLSTSALWLGLVIAAIYCIMYLLASVFPAPLSPAKQTNICKSSIDIIQWFDTTILITWDKCITVIKSFGCAIFTPPVKPNRLYNIMARTFFKHTFVFWCSLSAKPIWLGWAGRVTQTNRAPQVLKLPQSYFIFLGK